MNPENLIRTPTPARSVLELKKRKSDFDLRGKWKVVIIIMRFRWKKIMLEWKRLINKCLANTVEIDRKALL